MGAKTYAQYCGVARALDVVGERWSLLVVRELLEGPKRYTDLQHGLPGVATDVLATRLRDLEANGVVTTRELPPPAASRVYELTELGRDLAPVIGALARWGGQLLGPTTEGVAFRSHWLALGLRGRLRRDRPRDVSFTVQVVVPEGPFHLRVENGRLTAADGQVDDPALVIESDAATLGGIAQGRTTLSRAIADGRLTVTGSRTARRLLTATLDLG